MNILKKNYHLILLFFFILIYTLILSPIDLDEIWSYGFAHNLYSGLIPYKDFNMVITPFHPFIMSLPMYIFGSNILLFHIENAIVITIMLYLLFKLIGKNTYFLIPFFIWPLSIIYPNYNVFALFLFILLIYLEDKESNDYLIGFIIGLLFLTKQSIGLPVLLTIIFTFDKEKIIKRLIGFIIPNIIFFIYLLITNSLKEFIDLCVLGLLDFNNGNGSLNVLFFITIIFIVLIIISIIKDKKNIINYYLLFFSSIVIPLFDYYHYMLFFIAFLIVFFINNKTNIRFDIVGKVLLLLFVLLELLSFDTTNSIYPNDINRFEYRYMDYNSLKSTKEVNELIKKYNKVIIIGQDSYYHKLILDEKINYLDLINKGNLGYHGTDKLLKMIKELDKDYYYFVNRSDLKRKTQTDPTIIKYIINNGKLIEKTKYYDIYRLDN